MNEKKGIQSIFSIAWKNVIRKLFRNVVVGMAVSLLVALLIFALLFNNSVKEDIDEATRKLGADIVIVPPEAKDLAEDFILESKEKTFYMDKAIYDEVVALDDVEQATYHIYLDTIESGCCSIVEGQVVVFDQKTDFIVTPWLTAKSRRPLKEGEVYIGSYVAEYLGLLETVTLFDKEVVVAGELEETGIGFDHGLFVRLEDLDLASPGVAGQYRAGQVSIVFLRLKEGADPQAVTNKIVELNPAVGIMTRASIGGGVKNTLKDITRIFTITIVISSVLAILLAWSTFTALANERQKEVGIMRAIGATRGQIMRMFLSEAVFISALGGILGVVVGHLLIRYLAQDFELLSSLGAISFTSLKTILLTVVSLGAGVLVCLFGALLPVLRLANMEPLLAIKEE